MLDLALHQNQGPISLSDISSRQEISLSYLEQLFSKLRRNGLVASVRGPGGGYKLNGRCQDIQVAQIIDAVDESVDATNCKGKGDCQDGVQCLTHHLWSELSIQIHTFLSSISLASLIERQEILDISVRQNEKSQEKKAVVEEKMILSAEMQ
jgi:Rrf2 family iron-sulfur cluster assembly transcriptional regulator